MTTLEPTKLCTYTPQQFDILSDWNYSSTNLGEYIANKLKNYNGIINIKFKKPSNVLDASIIPFSNNCTLSGFCQYQYIKYGQSIEYTKINLFGLYGVIGSTEQRYGSMPPKFTQFTIIGSQISGKETWLITKAIIDATIDSSAIYTNSSDVTAMPADNGINTKSLTTTIDTDSIKNEILNSISSEYVSVASFSELKNQVDSADSDANSLASRIGLMSTTCTSLESKIDGLNGKYVDISNCLNDQKDQGDDYIKKFNAFVQEYNTQKNSMQEMFDSSIKDWKKMLEDSSIKTNEATQAADVAYKAAIDACIEAGKASNAVSDSSSKINKFQIAFDASYAEYVGWLNEANKNASSAVKNASAATQAADAAYKAAIDACTMVDNYSVDISNRLNKLKMDISIADASFKQYKADLLNAYKAAIGQFTAVEG